MPPPPQRVSQPSISPTTPSEDFEYIPQGGGGEECSYTCLIISSRLINSIHLWAHTDTRTVKRRREQEQGRNESKLCDGRKQIQGLRKLCGIGPFLTGSGDSIRADIIFYRNIFKFMKICDST